MKKISTYVFENSPANMNFRQKIFFAKDVPQSESRRKNDESRVDFLSVISIGYSLVPFSINWDESLSVFSRM